MKWMMSSLCAVTLAIGLSQAQAPIIENARPDGESFLGESAILESSVVSQESIPTATQILTDRFWLSRSAMLGWAKSQGLPDLVRVPAGTGPQVPSHVAQTDALFVQGFAGEAGFWLPNNRNHGIDLSGLLIFQTSLRRGPDAFFAPDNQLAGVLTTEARTRFFTIDANFRTRNLLENGVRIDWLVGYRYAYLGEDQNVDVGVPMGISTLQFADRADTKNQFHGGQLGFKSSYQLWDWTFDATVKLAIGAMITDGDLLGSSRAQFEFGPDRAILQRQIASLIQRETHFALMPTLNVRLSRPLTEHGRMYFGYDFLYLSHLSRPENIIQEMNSPSGPVWRRSQTDFWLQGISAGMEWRY